MKKFFVTLFILLILGAAAFFFGWAQFSVPPGAHGVMSSKTHGIDPRPISAGEFRWVWYKLIPTNVTIKVFTIAPVHRTINATGTLPSGRVYALFAGDQVDFSWDFNATFSFTLKEDILVPLVMENTIASQEEFAGFQEDLADEIEAFIIRYLSSPVHADEMEHILAGSSEILEKQVAEHFPAISSFSCLVNNVRFPDFILYQQVRSLYENFMSRQKEYLAASMGQKAEGRINTLIRIDELERMGELLSRYPVLLDYLRQVPDRQAE